MLVQHDALLPNKFRALELCRHDKDSKRFTSTLFDNFGKQERRFTSADRGPEKLTWERSLDRGLEQFVIRAVRQKTHCGVSSEETSRHRLDLGGYPPMPETIGLS
jgi:hypothetical protein